MSTLTYFKFSHTGDIFQKTTTTNAAGQQYAAYAKAESISFQFQTPSTNTSTGDERRMTPYQESIPKFEAIVPVTYSTYIDYGNRFQNIKDRNNTVIDSGKYEIVGIQPKFGISGKKHHIVVSLRKVVELWW